MSHCFNKASRRATSPACEGLEPRELLSMMGSVPMVAEVHKLANNTSSFVPKKPLLPNLPATPQVTGSTSAPNGDLNPYGVAYVPANFPKGGSLKPGDVLVSNFNAPSNLQGTGTSIVKTSQDGTTSLFAQTPPGTGLTTALGVLSKGFVVVGSLPSTDGTSATARAGSLFFIDKNGNVVAEYSNPRLLDGPWDLTIDDHGSRASIFVANVISGTVTRLDVSMPARGNQMVVKSATEIASGYTHRGDPAAFELGPTGLAFDAKSQTLYVASTADNKIYAVKNAAKASHSQGVGKVIYADQAHLHGPLGLAFAPNGNLITANGDAINTNDAQASELVEFTRNGKFVAVLQLNTSPDAAFGLAVSTHRKGAQLAAVDDVLNQIDLFTVGQF